MGKVTFVLLGSMLCSLVGVANARDITPTIYDDGLACPGNCDAHVVLHRQDNGSRYASLPSSTRSAPAACVAGQTCRVCFGDADDTCMETMYRGGGPPVGRFDFTPAFYAERCPQPTIPTALKRHCEQLDAAAGRLGYNARINCFEQRAHPSCREVMAAAEAGRQADLPKLTACTAEGQAAFNRRQTKSEDRRANNCAYSEMALGRNSRGVTWRLLLPAACREGSYVGEFGTDCCSSDSRFAAHVHPECSIYFRRQ